MRSILLALLVVMPTDAYAWGSEGHGIIVNIAYAELTVQARAKVDAMLAADPDPLTAHDVASEAIWADRYREAHPETAAWHFVDDELDHADLKSACFGYPKPAEPASAGPAQDCVVDKIREFEAELKARSTSDPERLRALKYLLHLVGDEAQPLHASDNQDRGGNCVPVRVAGARATNLHAYWDTGVVKPLGVDPNVAANMLRARITASERRRWAAGSVRAWAKDSYKVARKAAYTIGSPAGCGEARPPIDLLSDYQAKAQAAAMVQLQKAGVRLAAILNRALSQ